MEVMPHSVSIGALSLIVIISVDHLSVLGLDIVGILNVLGMWIV
jgi:hypothetical protein